jgi:transposase
VPSHRNPIEEAFAKIKNLLRNAAARSKEALLEAIAAALFSAVTAEDARGFFEHAGYRPIGHTKYVCIMAHYAKDDKA